MKEKIRWGILGPGRIARKFASDLKLVEDAELVAVGSRSLSSAEAFAKDFPVQYIHDSYEGLVKNDDVDVIYIATPHSFHYENTLLCLNYNKAVLCEKPFAINSRQAREMIALAKEKKVFLMEAMWSKFLPHFNKVREMIANGELGEVKSFHSNFGFKPVEPIAPRIFDPALGGGTILDIGIYNIFWAMSMLGEPQSVSATVSPNATGVDEQCAVLFTYKNGAMAQLYSTFTSNLATDADICGDKGRIRLTTRFYEPSATIEYYPQHVDSKQIVEVDKEPGFGYQYEARHVNECLKKGLTESPIMSFDDTLKLMEMLDKVRSLGGVKYPEDDV
ncbi:Gfo/Idh/MocA family oxidoreductase [Danxiaibacter flavus]|uniref:Gfo/Idh/MocA family oxidoreductase n=1 Tax=Danxiaibacter flavus TaxID=3049108 RepID=A0ABV3ZAR5_9BACT|nr:Gfo/Idh/MocA family oxidoreductase [Chitinophagaceae bacterium DXS]